MNKLRFSTLSFLGMLLGFVAILTLTPSSPAKAVNDLQLINPISLELPLYKKMHLGFDYQDIIADNVTRINRLILTPSLIYNIGEHVGLQAGYNQIAQYSDQGVDWHGNLFQTLMTNQQWKGFYISHAVTTEQEIFDRDRVSAKIGYRISLGHQIKHTRWRALLSNELAVNLNNVPQGPQAGIDQNRTFIGLGRCFTLRFCTRTGYQLQYIHDKEGDDRLNHRILLGVIINTTGPTHIERYREKNF